MNAMKWVLSRATVIAVALSGGAALAEPEWQEPGLGATSRDVGLRTAVCLSLSPDPNDAALLCAGLSCPAPGRYEFWTLLDGGAWLDGPARLMAGRHSTEVARARNEPATGHMKIATSNGPVDASFLRAIRCEKELRVEAAQFVGASFPLTKFQAELDRVSASCDQP